MSVSDPVSGRLITLGEALVCIVPTTQVSFAATRDYHAFPGGAELNTCVAVRRLGRPAVFLTRIGDDGPGRILLRAMTTNDVMAESTEIDPDRTTGVYLREWLPDGARRLTYYRRDSAATQLGITEMTLPRMTAADIALVTGITPALGPGPRRACERLLETARDSGATTCFDPNYRPQLWESAQAARTALLGLARSVDVLLLSEDDSALMYGSTDADTVLPAALAHGIRVVVFKQGDRGVSVAASHGSRIDQPAAPVTDVLDPVGAGDGFNGGFLAGLLAGLGLAEATELGAYVGARAVEATGDHAGYPELKELPDELRTLLEHRHHAGHQHTNAQGAHVES